MKYGLTENGAIKLNYTKSALVNLFGLIGSMRQRQPKDIVELVDEASKEDLLYTIRCIFYARDIRRGLGERETTRIALNYLANQYPDIMKKLFRFIPEYGRWDDMYIFISTPIEADAFAFMKRQLDHDLESLQHNRPVSLLAKWLKSENTSSTTSRAIARLTMTHFGMSPSEYRKALSKLRKAINLVERDMSAKQWENIEFSTVPSYAMLRYQKAFYRQCTDRFIEYLTSVKSGKAKINASTLFPYDIVRQYDKQSVGNLIVDDVLEAQWKALPNYVEPNSNVLVVADTSGSMQGLPMYVSTSLAIYFAERNHGPYKDIWINFSNNPTVQKLKGDTLADKINNLDYSNWDSSTNLEAVFRLILNIAKENNLSQEDLPQSIVVISDMEVNSADYKRTFNDGISLEFAKAGYVLPTLIYWNVNARNNTFLVDSDRPNTMLCSGSNPSVFKQCISAIGKTPLDMVYEVLNQERYTQIIIS